jgi:hypothetical protein
MLLDTDVEVLFDESDLFNKMDVSTSKTPSPAPTQPPVDAPVATHSVVSPVKALSSTPSPTAVPHGIVLGASSGASVSSGVKHADVSYNVGSEPAEGDDVLNSRIRLPDGSTLNRRLVRKMVGLSTTTDIYIAMFQVSTK